MTIGEHIRKIRKQQGHTLKYVSENTGLSIAFLSQLETNKCNATMASLRNIADCLGLHPSAFFEIETPDHEFKKEEHSEAFYYEDLSRGIDAPFIPQRVYLEPGATKNETVSHEGYEFIYCIKGTLTLTVGTDKFELQPGDTYMYDANQPHYWYNFTESTVEFIVVNEGTAR